MSYFKPTRSGVCAALCLLGASTAQATLFDRGGGLVYDDALNITWTQNGNVSGLGQSLSFDAAVAWADNLVFGGFSDWRLPHGTTTASQPAFDCRSGGESQCRANEMGYMFYYNLHGTFTDNKTGTQSSGEVTLNNIQDYYWTSTAWPNASAPWTFKFNGGVTGIQAGGVSLSAWAVRDGDVAAIPEPETYAMLLAGLGLLGFFAQRRKQKSLLHLHQWHSHRPRFVAFLHCGIRPARASARWLSCARAGA
jgi:hypothetical protein